MLVSIIFHSASALYVLFVPFYFLYQKKGITVKQGLLFVGATVGVGQLVRWLFIQGIINISYYANYVSYSLNHPFFQDYWKIVFGQLLLAGAILLLRKRVVKARSLLDEMDQKRMKFIWVMCVFDLITIPITYYIHLWRGYEYFYLARLVMWGYLITIFKKMFSTSSHKLINVVCSVVFMAWLIFMVYNNWESSGFMPYIFAPFSSL